MNKNKTKNATAVVKEKKIDPTTNKEILKTIGYLTEKDEEKGLDIELDMKGYVIESL